MKKLNKSKLFFILSFCFISPLLYSQQDPQYTQYMYNTISVNPAYAGTSGAFSAVLMHRSQWLGLEGAPETQILGLDAALDNNVGIGFNIINDKLGPSKELYIDGDFSYTIDLSYASKLSFGLKLGVRYLDIDFNKLNPENPNDDLLRDFKPSLIKTAGIGVYYDYDEKGYLGISVANLLNSRSIAAADISIAEERLHLYFIGGYVYDITNKVKLKPAFLLKAVPGAPLSLDLNANLYFNEKFTLGLGYRWSSSVNVLGGFQINDNLLVGYAYDFTTTRLNQFSYGSHEIMLKYIISKKNKYCTCKLY